jgi:hypothetical protein
MLDNLLNLHWLFIIPIVVLDLVLHFHNGNCKSKSLPTCQLDCLLFIYKAHVRDVREDAVSVKCITYCRTDGSCDLGGWIFVHTPQQSVTSGLRCITYQVPKHPHSFRRGSIEETINHLLPLYSPLGFSDSVPLHWSFRGTSSIGKGSSVRR